MHTKARSLLRVVLLFLAIIYPGTPFATPTSLAASLTNRSITLSNSLASATGVNYLVQFTTPSNVQSMIIEFCGDSPLIGATCDTSASNSTGLPTFSATSATFTNVSGVNNWSYLTSQWRMRFTKSTGATVSAGNTVSFTIGNVTNIRVARTFYARIYTYSDTAYGGASPYSSATSPGGYVDAGGFAMSTATSFVVTARVMEALSFCVSGVAPGTNCSNTSSPDLTIGHGSNNILDNSQVDSATAYVQVSTNAQNGVAINMKSGTNCAGLSNDNGTTCAIVAQNSGSSPAIMSAGSGLFGTGITGSSGLTANTKYDATGGKTNYDPSTVSGVRSTYGDTVATSTGPINNAGASVTFSASASTTTPAAAYSTNVKLNVTGTF